LAGLLGATTDIVVEHLHSILTYAIRNPAAALQNEIQDLFLDMQVQVVRRRFVVARNKLLTRDSPKPLELSPSGVSSEKPREFRKVVVDCMVKRSEDRVLPTRLSDNTNFVTTVGGCDECRGANLWNTCPMETHIQKSIPAYLPEAPSVTPLYPAILTTRRVVRYSG
jgi:hypothetical protein